MAKAKAKTPAKTPGGGGEPCPDCGVAAGKAHRAGCDVARCLGCGAQRLTCAACGDCDRRSHGRDVWTGLWPGVAECREYGFYREGLLASGWTGRTEDLNRLAEECEWDAAAGKWVRRTGAANGRAMTPKERARKCVDTGTAEDVDLRLVPADLEGRVAAAVREAVAAERERCAGLVGERDIMTLCDQERLEARIREGS